MQYTLSQRVTLLIPHLVGLFVLTSLPIMVLASHQGGTSSGLGGVISIVSNIINALIPITISLTVVYFLYGVSTYVLNSGDPEKRSEGRQVMLYGIVALFVMTSVWGLVNLITNTFSLDTSATPRAPGLPFISS